MISEFKIDGFKSLKTYSISFNKGLNVFIGPNGAGKSNICQALGILAAAAEGRISRYFLSLGGANTIFSKACSIDQGETSEKMISIFCKGFVRDNGGEGKDNCKPSEFKYEYTIKIEYKNDFRVLIETFRLYKKIIKNRFRTILRATREKKPVVLIEVMDKKEIGPVALDILKKEKKSIFEIEKPGLVSFLPMLGTLYYYCHLARKDLLFSRPWNIDPHVAKKSSDILEPSKLLSNGKWLANTINYMFNSETEQLNQVNAIISRILPGYEKVEPSIELGARSFKIIDINGIDYPAQCLSDGTVKALALLIGVLGQQHDTSIIEEPENYLHPWACQLLIDFFRDYFENGVLILTTHSETILNSINPKEIVIVENIDGRTKCNRLSYKMNLAEAIKASGFGCGYHYLAGSLGGVPE